MEETPKKPPDGNVGSSNLRMECENLRRNLNSVMDERDQMKITLEEVRGQFTAETRLRQYLEKMVGTVKNILSNRREDANYRVEESLKILMSLNLPEDETLQTTGYLLTDLSYSDQETIYGCIPTSAQRKKALQRETLVQSAGTSGKSHHQPMDLISHTEPKPTASHILQVPKESEPVENNNNVLHLPNTDGYKTFAIDSKSKRTNRTGKTPKKLFDDGFLGELPSPTIHHQDFIEACQTFLADLKHELPAKTPLKNFKRKGASSKPLTPSDVQPMPMEGNNHKKHHFVLWMGSNPTLCSYCRERVYSTQFVRKCRFCGQMVHANRCEQDGQCLGDAEGFKYPKTHSWINND